MSYLLSMLQVAGNNSARLAYDNAAKVAKHKAAMEARSKRVWGAVFGTFDNKASTNQLAGHMDRSAPSVLKAMHNMEAKGWVRRAGTILKTGPGKAQIIWEWLL